jgi:predicted N-acetyltransferase YhbS
MARIEAVTEESFPGLIETLDLVFGREAPRSMQTDVPLEFAPENWPNLRIVREAGRVVAHIGLLFRDASLFGHTLRLALVGAVATHPDFRGRGLATELLHHCFELARARGAHALQISGARGLYLRNGARAVGCRIEYALAPEQLAETPDPFTVRPMTPGDVDAAARLYRAKPVRYIRPREDWLLQLQHDTAQARPAVFRCVRHADGLQAYVVVRKPTDKPDTHVVEYAGRPAAVLAGLAHVRAELDLAEIRLAVLPWDREMRAALQALGAPSKTDTASATIRIVNFPALMESMRPWLAECLGEADAARLAFRGEGDLAVFGAGSDHLEVADPADLVEILFGVAGEPHPTLAAHPGPLGDILPRSLPLPLPNYDLTYV